MYEENFGSLSPYKDYSMEIEKYNHPYWQKEDLQKEVYIFVSLIKKIPMSITFNIVSQ